MDTKTFRFLLAFVCISVSIIYSSLNYKEWQSFPLQMSYYNINFQRLFSNKSQIYKYGTGNNVSRDICMFDTDKKVSFGYQSKPLRGCKNTSNIGNRPCYKVTDELKKKVLGIGDLHTVIPQYIDSKTDMPPTYHYIQCPEVKGRLGNMMFQVAATIGFAKTLKHKPIINPSHPLVKLFDINNVSAVQPVNSSVVNEVQLRNYTLKYIDSFMSHNLTLDGYFQSWKFFAIASEEVRKEFTIKSQYLDKAKVFLNSVRQNNSTTIIGLHVRRGDFLREGEQQSGATVADAHYIRKAMEFYRQRCRRVLFVVSSNGMWWSRTNIRGPDVIFTPFKEAILDMAVMSLCDHMIITSGTFSWWSGWLAGGKVVYLSDYPRPGLALATRFVLREHYYPPEWIGISNNAARAWCFATQYIGLVLFKILK